MSTSLSDRLKGQKSRIESNIEEYETDIKDWEEELELVKNLVKADDFQLTDDQKETLEYDALALEDLIKWREYHRENQMHEKSLVEAKLKFLAHQSN